MKKNEETKRHDREEGIKTGKIRETKKKDRFFKGPYVRNCRDVFSLSIIWHEPNNTNNNNPPEKKKKKKRWIMKMRNSGIVMEVTRQMTIATRQEEQEWMTLSKKYQRERDKPCTTTTNWSCRPFTVSSTTTDHSHDHHEDQSERGLLLRYKKPQPFTSGTSPELSKYSFFFSPPPLSHLSKYYNNPKCTEIKTFA